ncbi:MAG: hypothetical protein RQ966_20810 [Acetobacteraceae bacterium]|nr:hypothetical protein [Acetobacteraceae bacterium]
MLEPDARRRACPVLRGRGRRETAYRRGATAPPLPGETIAEAIRRAWDEGGELSAVVELRRHFPLISDGADARRCVRAIVGWRQPPALDEGTG